MHLQSLWAPATLLIAVAGAVSPIDAEKPSTTSTATATPTPCVAISSSGAFYDLRDDIATPIKEGEKEKAHKGPTEDYTWAKPHDWPYNFTMNLCAPVVQGVKDVVGVDKAQWKNVSAYYEAGGKTYSLGYGPPNMSYVSVGKSILTFETGNRTLRSSPEARSSSFDIRADHHVRSARGGTSGNYTRARVTKTTTTSRTRRGAAIESQTTNRHGGNRQ